MQLSATSRDKYYRKMVRFAIDGYNVLYSGTGSASVEMLRQRLRGRETGGQDVAGSEVLELAGEDRRGARRVSLQRVASRTR